MEDLHSKSPKQLATIMRDMDMPAIPVTPSTKSMIIKQIKRRSQLLDRSGLPYTGFSSASESESAPPPPQSAAAGAGDAATTSRSVRRSPRTTSNQSSQDVADAASPISTRNSNIETPSSNTRGRDTHTPDGSDSDTAGSAHTRSSRTFKEFQRRRTIRKQRDNSGSDMVAEVGSDTPSRVAAAAAAPFYTISGEPVAADQSVEATARISPKWALWLEKLTWRHCVVGFVMFLLIAMCAKYLFFATESAVPEAVTPPLLTRLYPNDRIAVCDDGLTRNSDCLPAAEVDAAIRLVGPMAQLLGSRRGRIECGEGDDTQHMAFSDVLEALRKHQIEIGTAATMHEAESLVTGDLLMKALKLSEANAHWNIRFLSAAGQPVSSAAECAFVESALAIRSLACNLREWAWFIGTPAVVIAVGITLLTGAVTLVQDWRTAARARESHVMDMVEKIIAVVRAHRRRGYPDGIPVGHVRDILVQHRQRRELLPIFLSAFDYVSNHESRVLLKEAGVGGEASQVLVWVPVEPVEGNDEADAAAPVRDGANDAVGADTEEDEDLEIIAQLEKSTVRSPSNASAKRKPLAMDGRNDKQQQGRFWQGAAFNTFSNDNNEFPSACLKIRGMFDASHYPSSIGQQAPQWTNEVRDAVLDKCNQGNADVIHIYVDRRSSEGVVMLRCRNRNSAGRAYQALHGEWFDGKLVTAKYLHEDKYAKRFSDAGGNGSASAPRLSPRNAGHSLRLLG